MVLMCAYVYMLPEGDCLLVAECDCARLCWQMCGHLGCGHWQTMSVTVCACTRARSRRKQRPSGHAQLVVVSFITTVSASPGIPVPSFQGSQQSLK